MFGKSKAKPVPQVIWDNWNERFEYSNGKTVTIKTLQEIDFDSEHLGEHITVKEFLKRMLEALWTEEENFNAKRPFGKSYWKGDMIHRFVELGLIQGVIEDGDVSQADEITFNFLVSKLIQSI